MGISVVACDALAKGQVMIQELIRVLTRIADAVEVIAYNTSTEDDQQEEVELSEQDEHGGL